MVVLGTILVVAVLSLVPQGDIGSKLHGGAQYDPTTGEYVFVEDRPWQGEAGLWTGALAAYVLLLSPLTAHRPLLRRWLHGMRWRKVHIAVGLTILIFSTIHAVTLVSIGAFKTWPSGTAALIVLAIHGASAVWKTTVVRRWGAARWRAFHIASGWIGLIMGLEHTLGMNLAAQLWG